MFANRSVLDWPTGTTVFKPEKCYNGYTIITPYRSHQTFLVDMAGRVAQTWLADPDRIAQSWFVRRLSSGNWMSLNYYQDPPDPSLPRDLMPDSSSSTSLDTELVEFDWHGTVQWRWKPPEGSFVNHDMARLQNGNTLVLLEKQAENPRVNAQSFRDEYIVETTPKGEVIWEWYTSEHLDEMGFSDEARRLMYLQTGPIWHTNTLSVLPGNELESTDSRFAKGNILTSQRETSLIYIIDKQSGKVVWTWGMGEGQLVGQHHPVMLNNGNILIYDNGGESGYPLKVRFYTRLVELDPVSGEIVWEYAHKPYTFKPLARFFSSTWGSVQRLPNGNTLSLDCHNGRVFEVMPSGEIVWEYVSPFSWGRGTQVVESGMFRVYRYGYDEIPEPDPIFRNTDGHMDCQPVQISIRKGMGLPSLDLP